MCVVGGAALVSGIRLYLSVPPCAVFLSAWSALVWSDGVAGGSRLCVRFEERPPTI